MSTINADNANVSWRKFNIDCQDYLPVSITFTGSPRTIVSAERSSDHLGGRLLQYHIDPDPSSQRNAPENLDPISLNGIDRATVSKDGKWIVIIAGTDVRVRNLTTDEVTEVAEHTSGVPVDAVDISPDSTKFATGSQDKVVRIFSINTGRLLLKLSQHLNSVLGVKFSPNGQYLASAAPGDVIRVWNACNNHELLQTSNSAIYHPTGIVDAATQNPACIPLGWSSHSDRVFTVSQGMVTVFQSSSSMSPFMPCYSTDQHPPPGTVVSFRKSTTAADNNTTLYSLATNGRIAACAAGSSLSFWDTFSSSKIGPTITFQDLILSLALSSDGTYLACGRGNKKIVVYLLRDILPLHFIVDPNSHLPFMKVPYAVFQPWIAQDLRKAYSEVQRPYIYFAFMTLTRPQMSSQEWNWEENFRKSLVTAPSIIGYIALARELARTGKQELALEDFDAVFCTCSADEIRPLLLIKAILIFLYGKRENAVARVKNLISSADDSEKYNCLQVLGNMYLLQGDGKEAFESFERARSLSFFRRGHHLMFIYLC